MVHIFGTFTTGTRNDTSKNDDDYNNNNYKKNVILLDQYILQAKDPVSLTFRDHRFNMDGLHSNHGSNHIETDCHVRIEWWSVETRLQHLINFYKKLILKREKIMLSASNASSGYRRVAEHYDTSIHMASGLVDSCT